MSFSHADVILIGKMLHKIGVYPLLEADLILDRVRLFFLLTRQFSVPEGDIFEEGDIGDIVMDFAGALRKYTLTEIRRILEEVRTGIWTGHTATQPEDVFYLPAADEQKPETGNILPFPPKMSKN